MPVRVRYAPSPTGLPHIGNLRTALYCWLAARHYGGEFIVRLEDTDRERLDPVAYRGILDSLDWLGLEFDEGPEKGGPTGPYIQSERLPIYRRYIEQLLESGAGYECYCSSERLAALREQQQRDKKPTGYDGRCRTLSPEDRVTERAAAEAEGRDPVVRFAMPREGTTSFTDAVRGTISFDNATIDDFVMLKSDGYPTYNFAHIVDDYEMKITHVMRGDEYIPSMPRYVRLHEALGFPLPTFVHLPLIVGSDKAKLSKRHGATSVFAYRDEGYLADAMVNFMAMLGWAFDDKTDVFTRDELVAAFSFDGIGKHPAVFNVDKLKWLNGVHMRRLDPDVLADLVQPFLEKGLEGQVSGPIDRDLLRRTIPLVQERLVLLGDIVDAVDFFFMPTITVKPDELVQKGMDTAGTKAALEAVIPLVESTDPFDPQELETAHRALAEQLGLKVGQLFGTIRVAVSGKKVAPPLFDTLVVLGRQVSVSRLRAALEVLA